MSKLPIHAIFSQIRQTDGQLYPVIHAIAQKWGGVVSTKALHENVILNPDKTSPLSHIEVTDDTIRIEFNKICGK